MPTDHGRAGPVSRPRILACLQAGRLPMQSFFVRFIADEAGTTVIEYGLIGALISVVCITGMTFVGTQLGTMYTAITTAVTAALR